MYAEHTQLGSYIALRCVDMPSLKVKLKAYLWGGERRFDCSRRGGAVACKKGVEPTAAAAEAAAVRQCAH